MSNFVFVDQHYAPHVADARAEARAHPALRPLLERQSSPARANAQLGFLLEFASIGVRVLRPAEETLGYGGQTATAAGLEGLGAALERMASEAARRRLLLIDDLVQLADLWRERFDSELDIAALVRRPSPAAAQRHAALRELAAVDELPFDSLAIELELGEFARGFGPELLRSCEHKLGSEVFAGMRYVSARIDQAALGADSIRAELDNLLAVVPELGPAMAVAGAAALRTHVDLIRLCIARGQDLVDAPPLRKPGLQRRRWVHG